MKPVSETTLLDNLPSKLKKDLDKNLCTCMDVPKLDVVKAILNGATTLEQVKRQTYAMMGAGCCIQDIERLIESICEPVPERRSKRAKLKGQ